MKLRKYRILICILFTVIMIMPLKVHSQEGRTIEEMKQLAEIAQDWAIFGVWTGYTQSILDWSESLYDGEEISGEDCIKIVDAVISITEVCRKRAVEIEHDELREETVGCANSVLKEANAYKEYYAGNSDALEKAKQYREEAEKHIEAIEGIFEYE